MTRSVAALALLAGCGGAPDTGPCGAPAGLVAATTDYSVGVLVTVAPDGTVQDKISVVGGDPLVRWSGGALWQINRQAGDTLRRYDAGALCRPVWEVALPRGANVHDAELAGDALWLAPYDQPALLLRDPHDGGELGSVDLGSLDADGLPELHDLVSVDGRLFVGAQRFDRSQVPWVSIEGRVVEIDPVSTSVVATWTVGPSPRLSLDPTDASRLLVVTGTYGVADGGVDRLDLGTGALERVLDEADLGRDIEGVAVSGSAGVVLVSEFHLDEGGTSTARCVDLGSWQVTGERDDGGWYADAVGGADGAVWLAVRRGWGDRNATGLVQVDPTDCSTASPRVATSFEPYSVAWVPEDGG